MRNYASKPTKINKEKSLQYFKPHEKFWILSYYSLFLEPYSWGPVHLRFWKLAHGGTLGTSHDGANGLRDWSTFVWSSLFFKLVIYCRKVKFKFLRKSHFGDFQSRKKWGKTIKNHQIHICGFHCAAKHTEAWIKICASFLVYSQIWLNLPRDDCHFSYISQWMITTLASNRNSPKKTLVWRTPKCN